MSVFSVSIVGGNIVGLPPSQLAALIRQDDEDLSEADKTLIASLQRNLDLNEREMREAFRILGKNNVPNERLGTMLVEIAASFANFRSGTLANTGDGPAIAALKSSIREAIDDGDLTKADVLLEVAARTQRQSFERSAVDLADTLARQAEIALTGLRYSEAAARFASAAAVLPNGMGYDDVRIGYLASEADAIYRQGDELGDNAALLSAIERLQRLCTLAPRERVPFHWATTQTNLGNALASLGARESSAARLEQAVVAYRAALLEQTRARVPLKWAMTQTNLGNALASLGARESSAARLEQAVAAYRAALLEQTRERVPLDWAGTQSNLGNALLRLGERESGTARLEQAVEAYRAALLEFTRERVPLDWAGTQSNLGNALASLGARESRAARLEQAVAAYRAALLEQTRERVPLDWAGTQSNLGNALLRLGARESGTAGLEQAVEAYRAALLEFTRERVPLDWAGTQSNLGNALLRLGERESGTARLEQALEAYRAALLEFTRERVPLGWAGTQSNLGNALASLGARESSAARLEQAVEAYQAALMEWTTEGSQHWHEIATRRLAQTTSLLALRRSESIQAQRSVGLSSTAVGQQFKVELITHWGNSATLGLCLHLVDVLSKLPNVQLDTLTFTSFKDLTERETIDEELIRAVGLLSNTSIHALDSKLLFIDDDDRKFELTKEELAEARTAGVFVHPDSGKPVDQFESKIIPVFVLSEKFKKLKAS